MLKYWMNQKSKCADHLKSLVIMYNPQMFIDNLFFSPNINYTILFHYNAIVCLRKRKCTIRLKKQGKMSKLTGVTPTTTCIHHTFVLVILELGLPGVPVQLITILPQCPVLSPTNVWCHFQFRTFTGQILRYMYKD